MWKLTDGVLIAGSIKGFWGFCFQTQRTKATKVSPGLKIYKPTTPGKFSSNPYNRLACYKTPVMSMWLDVKNSAQHVSAGEFFVTWCLCVVPSSVRVVFQGSVGG